MTVESELKVVFLESEHDYHQCHVMKRRKKRGGGGETTISFSVCRPLHVNNGLDRKGHLNDVCV